MQNAETNRQPLTAGSFFTSASCIRNSAFVLIALFALAVRLPQLADRPMHTDEAINGYIVGDLLAGKPFHYDPQDRHGPVLYLLAEPVTRLCGAKNLADLTETELRLTPVIIGSAMILLFGAAVEIVGFIPCLIAALLFAFAPLPVYYSRYFIHETLFVAATFGLILAGWRTLKKNSVPLAALTGLCASLMLAGKETAVLHFAALAGAVVCGWLLKREKFPSQKIVATAFLVFIAATVLLFTWFGKNWLALSDLTHVVSRFAARAGGEGHEKPFWYYAQLLTSGISGYVTLAMAVLGIFLVVKQPAKNRFLTLLAIYAVLVFLIYSAIPYKTPWLALNFFLPLTVFAGIFVERLWLAAARCSWRLVILIFLAATGFFLARDTAKFVFKIPADETNPYAYAHTSEDILNLAPKVDELARKNNITNPKIAVVMKDAWPMPWYLRKFSSVGFWQPDKKIGDADFFITASDPPTGLTNRLNGMRSDFFGVRPNVLILLWTPAVADGHQP
ncbi:MAG TPA: flippase activity-associated protein Agl23 [Candidatus Sulfotelmatobacter sp.]|nr:flippase activity-associated protein Agl23 [Candidatus Sulfotelmatobacter sp.]